jgi:hypothetical protein
LRNILFERWNTHTKSSEIAFIPEFLFLHQEKTYPPASINNVSIKLTTLAQRTSSDAKHLGEEIPSK